MNTITNIHNSILKKIQSGTIKQKPRWQFVLYALVYLFCFVVLSLFFFYLISFTAYVFHEHFIFQAIQFGPRTMFAMMHTIPSLLILLVIAIFLLLNALARHFAFAYMKPVTVTLGIGLVITLIVFGLVLDTDKDFRIARLGEGSGLGFFHHAFRDMIPRAIIHGTVVGMQGNNIMLKDDNGHAVTLLITDRTLTDGSTFAPGDYIGALVEKRRSGFFVMGIHKDVDDAPAGTSTGQ